MDVKEIAGMRAEILDKLGNWGSYSSLDPSSASDYNPEEEYDKTNAMIKELAMSRANETNRDIGTTLMEVKYKVGVGLAKILSRNLHPVYTEAKYVMIEQDGEVCGICQEIMEVAKEARALGTCSHKFHEHCIFEWVYMEKNYSLCRREMEAKTD